MTAFFDDIHKNGVNLYGNGVQRLTDRRLNAIALQTSYGLALSDVILFSHLFSNNLKPIKIELILTHNILVYETTQLLQQNAVL